VQAYYKIKCWRIIAMNRSGEYFIKLLSAFLKNEAHLDEAFFSDNLNEQDNFLPWDEILKISRIQCLSGAVYCSIMKLKEDLRPNEEIMKQFESDFFNTTLKSANQEYEMRQIINALNKNAVCHVLMKGFIVKEYYPVKDMRSMGDIDFLIKGEDVLKAENIMLGLGYHKTMDMEDVLTYEKGNITIEVHNKINYRDITRKSFYADYFHDAWRYVKTAEHIGQDFNYTYEFEPWFHFVFLMYHMAKHFFERGSGIRPILDIAVFIKHFGNNLDWEKIWSEFEKLNLVLFAENILKLCKKWFDIDIPYHLQPMEKDLYENLLSFMLKVGTHGLCEENDAISGYRAEYKGKDKLSMLLARIKYMIKVVFLDYKTMRRQYSYLRKFPFLLPAAWVHRAFRLITVKRKSTVKKIKGVLTGIKKSEEQYDLYCKLGL